MSMETLGIIFEGLIRPLLLWIREDSVGPALAGIIMIAGLIIIGYAFVGTWLDHMLIARARQVVGNRTDDEFANDFNTINQDLEAIPRIKTAWAEFSETLIRPRFDEQNNLLAPCENTTRPHVFFNLRELGMGPDFVKVFPSVFVGVGLSLTFLGLISALGEAVAAINASAGETSSIQTAIGNLLKISSAKFYASLFALFMSVLMTISLRLMSWKLTSDIGALNRSIEAGVRFLTPEKLAIDANEILKNQLSQLQTFNTDLAMKIGEQVQSSLKETLAPVIQKLDDMGGDMTEQNIKAIRDISEEVTKGIQGATAGSMDRVAETLDNISTKLGSLSETLSGALSNFDADFRQMLEGLKNSLKESTDGVAEGIGGSMTKMSEGIGQTATEVTEIIGGLTTTVQSLANAGAEISRQGGEELRKQVEAASQQASEQMAQAGRELASGFQESTQGLVDALGATTAQLRQLEQGLTGLPDQLTDVNSRLGTSATQIGEAAGQFGSATSGLRGLIEPLAQYAADTRQSITDITETMQTVSGQVGEASAAISDAVGVLDEEISAQLARLDGSDAQLARLLEGIEGSTTRILSSVNSFVTEVDNGFASSVGVLNESVSELEETFDRLRQSIEDTRAG
jgi:ABC-type transporter Mla subunit MlaD